MMKIKAKYEILNWKLGHTRKNPFVRNMAAVGSRCHDTELSD